MIILLDIYYDYYQFQFYFFFCNAPRRCRHFVEDAGRLEGMSSSSRPGAVTGWCKASDWRFCWQKRRRLQLEIVGKFELEDFWGIFRFGISCAQHQRAPWLRLNAFGSVGKGNTYGSTSNELVAFISIWFEEIQNGWQWWIPFFHPLNRHFFVFIGKRHGMAAPETRCATERIQRWQLGNHARQIWFAEGQDGPQGWGGWKASTWSFGTGLGRIYVYIYIFRYLFPVRTTWYFTSFHTRSHHQITSFEMWSKVHGCLSNLKE